MSQNQNKSVFQIVTMLSPLFDKTESTESTESGESTESMFQNSCVSRLCDYDSCNFVRLLKHLTPKLCILHRALIKVLSRHSREMKPKKPLFYLLLSCSSCLTKPSQPILIIYGQFMVICVFQLTIRNHTFFAQTVPPSVEY